MKKRELLGDKIARFLEWFGIKKRPGCGCERRQAKLNQAHNKLEAILERRKGKKAA
jgi:hypothetical protein